MPLSVFLSSTYVDLAEHRAEAASAIEGMGYHCVRMEDFPASERDADDYCRDRIKECQVLICVVGHLHGSRPKGSELSYTEREFNVAVEAGIDRLILIASEDTAQTAGTEPEASRVRQQEFRRRVALEGKPVFFTTPDDLAKKIILALHEWVLRKGGAGRARRAMASPPEPDLVHPYPLQRNFSGRLIERRELTAWLDDDRESVCCLMAIGGMGKSALSWVWLQQDVLGAQLDSTVKSERVRARANLSGVLWWSFYEREAGFTNFLNEAIGYVSDGAVEASTSGSGFEKIRTLISYLARGRFLFVLDGFERLLRAYAGVRAAYQGDDMPADSEEQSRACAHPETGEFLRQLSNPLMRSRVLITSRLLPKELDNVSYCREHPLLQLNKEDAVAFFKAQGIRGTDAEIEHACAAYGYHPLALRLLAGVIGKDKRKPKDIEAAARYSVVPELRGREQHHILEVSYDALGRIERQLLGDISAFRGPAEQEILKILAPKLSPERFEKALGELIDRGLVFADPDRKTYDLHPVVRQFAYGRTPGKKTVHDRLVDYFASRPGSEANPERLEDLNSFVEFYHHSVSAGRYDEAWVIITSRLAGPLYNRFGAHTLLSELLALLFPGGEDSRPPLRERSDRAWAQRLFAFTLSRLGQLRRAEALFHGALELESSESDQSNLGACLVGLADVEVQLGKLKLAKERYEACMRLSGESRYPVLRGVTLRDYGRLLAIQGRFDEALAQNDLSLRVFDSLETDQPAEAAWKEHRGLALAQRAWTLLMACDPKAAADAARRALELAGAKGYPFDAIVAEWLLGASLIPGNLDEARRHLNEALGRCQRLSIIRLEPAIFLDLARAHQAGQEFNEAETIAEQALATADRCGARLLQADLHNLLARLRLHAGDNHGAQQHARTGAQLALCDGEPLCYRPALDDSVDLTAHAAARV